MLAGPVLNEFQFCICQRLGGDGRDLGGSAAAGNGEGLAVHIVDKGGACRLCIEAVSAVSLYMYTVVGRAAVFIIDFLKP